MNKILLVDDDRELTSLLKELLDMEGFNVLVAHDGEQALHKKLVPTGIGHTTVSWIVPE